MTTSILDAKMRILITAKQLMAKQGYDGTSVRQICSGADTNVAMISYYFGGKEQIFEALFETFMPLDRVNTMGAAASADPVRQLRALIADVIGFRLKDPEIIDILRQETNLRTARLPIVQKHILPMYEKFQGILKRGKEAGTFHFRSLDTTLLFVMASLFAHASRGQIKPIATEDEPSVQELVDELVDYILGGLGYGRD